MKMIAFSLMDDRQTFYSYLLKKCNFDLLLTSTPPNMHFNFATFSKNLSPVFMLWFVLHSGDETKILIVL